MRKNKIIIFIMSLVGLITIFNILFRVILPIKPVKIRSNSMTPTYAKGDVAFYITSTNIKEGDIIIFSTPRFSIISRIVELNLDGTYRAKADGNAESLNYTNNVEKLDETHIKKSQIYGKVIFGINQYLFYTLLYTSQILIALGLINPIHNKFQRGKNDFPK